MNKSQYLERLNQDIEDRELILIHLALFKLRASLLRYEELRTLEKQQIGEMIKL